jgi:hypothetical protein
MMESRIVPTMSPLSGSSLMPLESLLTSNRGWQS